MLRSIILIGVALLATVAPRHAVGADNYYMQVFVLHCKDGRSFPEKLVCWGEGSQVWVDNQCSKKGGDFVTTICPPPPAVPLPSAYFSVGAGGLYSTGTEDGVFAGEFTVEVAIPVGNVRGLHVLGQASFGFRGDERLTGSGSAGVGYDFGDDPDQRPGVRVSTLFNIRGFGDGDSQDFFGIGGKFHLDVGLGSTGGVVWKLFAACEAGAAVYTDPNGQPQNDGWYIAPTGGLLLRL